MKITLLLVVVMQATPVFAASKKQKPQSGPTPAEPAEMRVDPNILNEYRNHTAVEANKVERTDIALIGVEPAIDVYELQKLQAKNDYFTVPIETSGKTMVAPRVWVGMPKGWELYPEMFVKLGVEMSYLNREGAQQMHQEPLNMDVRDNVTVHILPIIPTATWSLTVTHVPFNAGPWASVGVGSALSQITGTLDGVSQSGWTPVSRLAAGLSFGGTNRSALVQSVQIGAFTVAGSSQRLEWRSRGYLVGANFVL